MRINQRDRCSRSVKLRSSPIAANGRGAFGFLICAATSTMTYNAHEQQNNKSHKGEQQKTRRRDTRRACAFAGESAPADSQRSQLAPACFLAPRPFVSPLVAFRRVLVRASASYKDAYSYTRVHLSMPRLFLPSFLSVFLPLFSPPSHHHPSEPPKSPLQIFTPAPLCIQKISDPELSPPGSQAHGPSP